MKLILLVLSIFSFILPYTTRTNTYSSVVEEKKDLYLQEINNAYNKYNITEYSNPNYTVIIIEGICNDKESYGVFLTSMEAGSYFIKVSIDGIKYRLNEDSRDDTLQYAIQKSEHEIIVYVYDDINGVKTKRYEYALQNNQTYSNFGLNNGCDFNKLILNDALYIFKTISLLVLCIIALIIITILLMYINKFGLFNPNRIKKKVKVVDQINNEEYIIQNDIVSEDVEEDVDDFDIKTYLLENNYKTDYKLMTEEEKNNVMILLMSLKYRNIINEEQYEREVVNLWKK